jgi:hypothetical protein
MILRKPLLELRWPGVRHRIDFYARSDDGGGSEATFFVEKDHGSQQMIFLVPSTVSVEDIRAGWEAGCARSGSRYGWEDLFTFKGSPFVAFRVIWLPNGLAIVWYVIHVGGKPHDACQVMQMSRDEFPEAVVIERP